MNTPYKRDLYIALRALDRMSEIVSPAGKRLPSMLDVFLDSVWEHLRTGKGVPNLRLVEKYIDQHVVDEQDADYCQQLLNLYLYAVADP